MDTTVLKSREFKFSAKWFFLAACGAFVVSLLATLLGIEKATWASGGTITVLALALLACGTGIGFIFGLPKVSQDESAPAGADAKLTKSNGYRQLVNKSLEEVTDWLVKIIVGLGLVQLQQIPANLSLAAEQFQLRFGSHFESIPTQSLLIAMMTYYPVAGFFFGYLVTRIFLQQLFYITDTAGEKQVSRFASISLEARSIPTDVAANSKTTQQLRVTPSGVETPSSSAGLVSPAVVQSLTEIARTQLSELSNTDDIGAWVRGKLLSSGFDEALKGLQKLLSIEGDSPQTYFDMAVAADAASAPNDTILEYLNRARNCISERTPANLVGKIYTWLTYHYLYKTPPEGFRETQRLFNYCRVNYPVALNAAMWVNLASSIGQEYSYKKELGSSAEELNALRSLALGAVKTSVSMDPTMKENIKIVLLPNYGGKDPGENDLEVFSNDREFLQAVDLPT